MAGIVGRPKVWAYEHIVAVRPVDQMDPEPTIPRLHKWTSQKFSFSKTYESILDSRGKVIRHLARTPRENELFPVNEEEEDEQMFVFRDTRTVLRDVDELIQVPKHAIVELTKKGDPKNPTPLEADVEIIEEPPKLAPRKRKPTLDIHQPRRILPSRLLIVGDIRHGPLQALTAKEVAKIQVNISMIRKDESHIFESGATSAFLKFLLPGGWLDDVVVDFYMRILKERELRFPKHFQKHHFFGSFVFQHLEIFNSSTSKTVEERRSVLPWLAKDVIGYDLIECKKIFIPLNRPSHWALLVMDVAKNSFSVYDSLGFAEAKDWQSRIRIIKSSMDKLIYTLGHTKLGLSKWPVVVEADMPTQSNGSIGIFMLKYADYLCRDIPFAFTQG